MEKQRFSLLLLEPNEIYFEDFSVDIVRLGGTADGRCTEPDLQTAGRLKMCSRSLVFEAKGASAGQPLIKIMYKDCTTIDRQHQDGSEPASGDGQRLAIRCRQYIEMLDRGQIQPYRFVQQECTFLFHFHYAKLDECLQQICQLYRASTLPSYEQNSMIATIVYSRHSRVKFNPLWLNNLYERTVADFQVEEINPLVVNPGRLLVTNAFIYFQYYNNISTKPVLKVAIRHITGLSKHRYLLRQIGLRIRWQDEQQPQPAAATAGGTDQCLYLVFRNQPDRDDCWRCIGEQPDYAAAEQSPESMTLKWQNGLVSNYDYLLYLNGLADRSFQDLTQYPVFPWIVTDYTSPELNLAEPGVYRDLAKPVGALNPERLARLRSRYEEMGEPKFLYGSHYSTPGFVLYYLVRKHPELMLCLQNGKFDHPDRMFNSVADAYHNCLHNMSDFKELIPEFYDPEQGGDFLQNGLKIDFGTRFDGTPVGHVALPPWAQNSPARFVRLLRQALESDYVSARLHHWIDLIFGYRQQGQPALDADNVFYHLCYEGSVDLGQINDLAARHAIEVQISEFGQIPRQLFRTAHVSKLLAVPGPVGPAGGRMVLRALGEYCTHKDAITAVAIDRAVGHIFTTSKDGTMTCYSLGERRKIRSVQLSDLPISSVQLAPDRSIILGGWDNTIFIYNFDFGKISSTIRAHDDAVSCISYVPSYGLLVSGSWDCSLKIWNNYHNDSVVGYHVLEEKVVSLDTFAGERTIRVAVGLQSGELLLYELDGRTVHRPTSYTRDNQQLLQTHRGAVCEVRFSAKGTLIASAGEDRLLYVTDADSSMTICRKELAETVRCLCWTVDGKYLLLGDRTGTLHVWNMLLGVVESELTLHSACVYRIECIDEKRIVSCGKDDNNYCVKLWDVAT